MVSTSWTVDNQRFPCRVHEQPGGPLGQLNDGEPTTAIAAADAITDFFDP